MDYYNYIVETNNRLIELRREGKRQIGRTKHKIEEIKEELELAKALQRNKIASINDRFSSEHDSLVSEYDKAKSHAVDDLQHNLATIDSKLESDYTALDVAMDKSKALALQEQNKVLEECLLQYGVKCTVSLADLPLEIEKTIREAFHKQFEHIIVEMRESEKRSKIEMAQTELSHLRADIIAASEGYKATLIDHLLSDGCESNLSEHISNRSKVSDLYFNYFEKKREIETLESSDSSVRGSIDDIVVDRGPNHGKTLRQSLEDALINVQSCRAKMDERIQEFMSNRSKIKSELEAEAESARKSAHDAANASISNLDSKLSDDLSRIDNEQRSLIERAESNSRAEIESLSEQLTSVVEALSKREAAQNKIVDDFIDEVRAFAKGYIDANGWNLGTGDHECFPIKMPEAITIGGRDDNVVSLPIYSELFGDEIKYSISPFEVNLRNGGNILIHAPESRDDDQNLYDAIIGLLFIYYEKCPLKSIRVHMVDVNEGALISRIYTTMRGILGQEYQGIINKSKSLDSVIDSLNNGACEQVSGKLGGSVQDFFDLYEVDKTDQFNVVIVRSGLSNLMKGSESHVRILRNLFQERGLQCGVRFVIVDDFDDDPRVDPSKLDMLQTIRSSALTIEYSNNAFSHEGRPFVFPSLNTENRMKAVESECRFISESVNNSISSIITYDDIGFGNTFEEPRGSEITIPIGKSGNRIVELPIDCAHGNIGFVFIGRPGTGKSSLFRSIILNGCMKYSPRDLIFYLLDFKSGSETSNYVDGVPHIKQLSKENKLDDAYCLFGLINDEMERRNKLFQEVRPGDTLSNLAEYNQYVESNPDSGAEHLPRIIVLIDEFQQIYNDGDDEAIRLTSNLLLNILVRCRSAGIHFVVFAQNFSIGKASRAGEILLANINGRGMFELEDSIARGSNFGSHYNELCNLREISNLKKGELFLSYSDDLPIKVKVAYTNEVTVCKSRISNKYPDYPCKPVIIGVRSPVFIDDTCGDGTYRDVVAACKITSVSPPSYSCVVAEDYYTHSMTYLDFNETVCGTIILGGDNLILCSVPASIAMAISTIPNVSILYCNGSRGRGVILTDSIKNSCSDVKVFPPEDIDGMLEDIYREYHLRQSMDDGTAPVFYNPIFVFIHDCSMIEKIAGDHIFHKVETPRKIEIDVDSEDALDRISQMMSSGGSFYNESAEGEISLDGKRIGMVLGKLIENGSRYNIHFVLSCTTGNLRGLESMMTVSSNYVLFNKLDLNLYNNALPFPMIRKMLQEMSESKTEDSFGSETMAIVGNGRSMSKVRPILHGKASSEL